ncbi:Integral membrane protein [Caballeronia sordidicola]|uniref:Integral membrane protein n=1 Tax=Caballeronia sordidicola TaxID=196367 RepID=A0A226WPW0_CABSO|nr:Integral membrane protein [Caballeronia sordidicola]
MFYGVALAFNSLTYNVLWWPGRSQRTLIEPDVQDVGLRAITRHYALTLLGAVLATHGRKGRT